MSVKKHGQWWLPKSEEVGLKWFDNPRGERPEVIDEAMKYVLEPETGIALDVGAHVGTWAVELANHFKHTHAFEPIFYTWLALSFNIKERQIPPDKVTPWLFAIGAKLGNCQPTMVANATLSSHIDPGQTGCIGVMALDDRTWGGEVKLIKLDIEGYEWFALQGAEKTIEAHHPVLVIEWKPHRLNKHGEFVPLIEAFLEKHGYDMVDQLEIDRIYV